jgi:hypothetical protein
VQEKPEYAIVVDEAKRLERAAADLIVDRLRN